jgi:RNA polymerase sigma-70 factor (ECF subfamily)
MDVARRRLFSVARAGPDSPAAAAADPGVADAALLAQVARGDTDAFETLYDRYAAAVYGMALRVVRDPAQSEEVAQEVLVEAWRTAARYVPDRGSVRAWLLTMARHRAVDRVRSAQAAVARDVRAAAGGVHREYDEVSEAVLGRLEGADVRNCLGSLTELQRESIELAYYRGNTHREVAALLEVPMGTVKTRLRDGLIRLRDCLGVA